MALFLPKDRILYTDISLTDAMKLDSDFQQADGTNLPFNDGEFDFVYSCDVLEHIPAEKHQDFISESVRVAKYCAIFVLPIFFSRCNKCRRKESNAHYRELAGEDFIWLEEHRKNGLPKIKKINELLNQWGFLSSPFTMEMLAYGKKYGTVNLMLLLQQKKKRLSIKLIIFITTIYIIVI